LYSCTHLNKSVPHLLNKAEVAAALIQLQIRRRSLLQANVLTSPQTVEPSSKTGDMLSLPQTAEPSSEMKDKPQLSAELNVAPRMKMEKTAETSPTDTDKASSIAVVPKVEITKTGEIISTTNNKFC
jgi:hypothetical protein